MRGKVEQRTLLKVENYFEDKNSYQMNGHTGYTCIR
jgi:hypothetical protein